MLDVVVRATLPVGHGKAIVSAPKSAAVVRCSQPLVAPGTELGTTTSDIAVAVEFMQNLRLKPPSTDARPDSSQVWGRLTKRECQHVCAAWHRAAG
jgi:hypothetical protein